MKNTISKTSGTVKREKAESNAKIFVESFSPYREKHIYQKPEKGLFDDSGFLFWQTSEQYLTDRKIEKSIAGLAVIGYFLSFCPRCFCVDIDDHTGKGAGYLLSLYESVRQRLSVYPSILCKTPRGLHCFYLLTHPVPEILLIEKARLALTGVPVEVKPTAKIGLRIPQEQRLLDPRSMNPLNLDFAAAVDEAAQYHPFELFGASIMDKTIVEDLKARKDKVLRIKVWEKIGGFEAEYAAVHAGATNDALCELIPVYRSAGLTPEEAAAEFAALLAPEYAGELKRNFRRLLQRVRSFYKNPPETRFNALPKQEPDLFTEIIVENISALVTGGEDTRQRKAALTRKRRTVQKAVLTIESWKRYIDGVVRDKRFLEMWNYLYPYFKKNTKEGYYPLSRNILKKIHKSYKQFLLPFLEEAGYLERSPYKYSSIYGICYYYKIHSGKFMAAVPQKTAPTAKIRYAKAKDRAGQIRDYKEKHPLMSNRAIAKALGVSHFTVNKALKKM